MHVHLTSWNGMDCMVIVLYCHACMCMPNSCYYHLVLSLEQVIVSLCMVFPLLSDNFCSKICLVTLVWCSSHLQGKQFQFFVAKQLISSCTFLFQNWSSQDVQSYTCKECNKNIQFMATSSYYNPTTYTSSESLRNI